MKKWKCVDVHCLANERCHCDCFCDPTVCMVNGKSVRWKDITSPPLPKLTAEVFKRQDCPECAKSAAVNEDGSLMWFSKKPYRLSHSWYAGLYGRQGEGVFDASDWQHSLIERPEKRQFKSGDKVRIVDPASSMNGKPGIVFRIEDDSAYVCFMLMPNGIYKFNQLELIEPAKQEAPTVPSWCKVGNLCYITPKSNIGRREYVKIKEVNGTNIELVNGFGFSIGAIKVGNVTEARVRPWTFEEAAKHIGEALQWGNDLRLIVAVLQDEAIIGSGDNRFVSFETMATTGTLMDGSPCGVLEHLEDGKWVE